MAQMPPVNMDDFNKWKTAYAIVKETDMEEFTLTESKEIISTGIEKMSGATGINYEAASKYIKEAMDKQFGPYWHCVMGEGFSFEITKQAKTILYMYYAGTIAVLLFKCWVIYLFFSLTMDH